MVRRLGSARAEKRREKEKLRDRDLYEPRGRDRDHRRRSRSPDRRCHARSHDARYGSRSRSRSADRFHRCHDYHRRSPSPDARSRERRREGSDDERDRHRSSSPSQKSYGVAKEHQKKGGATAAPHGGDPLEGDAVVPAVPDLDELEMMRKLGIPMGFDSTKGKPVSGNDVSGVRVVTKRQPRQYMNRRGGFNRPLHSERNQ